MPPQSTYARVVASRPNLARAWLWTRSNSDRNYKIYFRTLYRSFALAADDALESIRERLLAGTYEPSAATKVFTPKASGILRPITLLTVEDQIVFQAMTNIVAERLYSRVHRRYNRSVFGHLYAGVASNYFYTNWRHSYRLYTESMRRTFAAGYRYSASFDLTACYDTIDHAVLTHFLREMRLDEEFCKDLTHLLSHWTEASGGRKPLYHGHGIPQGPLPSGLLAECVLKHFDDAKRPPGVRYYRYVDDIRLFAKDEAALRLELVRLDQRSKEVGLVPQASKIDIHVIANIDDEIKSVSRPPEAALQARPVNQDRVRRRLVALSPKGRVTNSTRFKWLLASAAPNAGLALRLIKIARNQPHLYEAIFRHLQSYSKISRRASEACVRLMREFDLYPAYTAALIRAIRDNLHSDLRRELQKYCRSRLSSSGSTSDPFLRAAAASVLLMDGVATWPQVEFNVCWPRNWWVRTDLIAHVQLKHVGKPALAYLCNRLLRDDISDVSLIAAEVLITQKLGVARPIRTINTSAQWALKRAGLIGQIRITSCPIESAVVRVLGQSVRAIRWRPVLGARRYRQMVSRFAVWKAYEATDATAWVVLTDTINDILLDVLFTHDGGLGGYTIGKIGSVLGAPTSRFAAKYPKLWLATSRFHSLRLEADLAHSMTKSTMAPTRRIRFKELPRLKRSLAEGYSELWALW